MKKFLVTCHLSIVTCLAFADTITGYTWTGRTGADGSWPRVGVCAAPRDVPLHTRVRIGGREYLVTDRTNLRYNGRWDIYFNTRAEAIQFGKQELAVKILK